MMKRAEFEKRADLMKLADFVERTQPDVIVLGAKDVRCRELKEELLHTVGYCWELKKIRRQIDVLYADEVRPDMCAAVHPHAQR